MSDHIGEPDGMICPHCGLPADRNQNGIQGYRCGSSYCESFKPQWARSMTCLELQNGQLQERIKRLEEAGDRITQAHCPFLFIEWQQAKEAKP
jgi:predicted amidophosphoribosyltransferase